ncbi:hypothetical protein ACF0H5_009030 [Mactra antiquata]
MANLMGSYDSEFEFDVEAERKRKKYEDLAKKEKKKGSKKGHKRELEEEYNNGSKQEFQRDRSRDKTDMDVIRENHKFLWNDDDDEEESWAKRLAKKYYDKLFKEYCIADLSRYKENKIAMRWRIEKEVHAGKGQFMCGNKKCNEHEGLKSWEVNFAYMENGEKKNALVKLRLCPDCSYKLNFHHRRKEIKSSKKKDKHRKKMKKSKRSSSESEGEDQGSPKPTGNEMSEVRNKIEEVAPGTSTDKSDENIWSGPAKIVEEKSREEEFDEYFADMFM